MAYTPKELTGALFKNDKGDNPARPDYRGDAMINGVHVEISAWIKPLPSDASKRFMSLSFKEKTESPKTKPQPQRSAPAGGGSRQTQNENFDDSIPF